MYSFSLIHSKHGGKWAKISIWMNFSTPCIFIFSVAPLLPLVLLKLPILLNQKSFHIWFLRSTQNCREPNSKWSKWWGKIIFVCPEISRVFNAFRISTRWHYHALQIVCPKWHRKNLNFESYNQGWKMYTAQLIHVGKKTQRQTWPLPDSSIDAVPSLKLLKIA